MDKQCEELAHSYLFPTGKFVYNAERECGLSAVKHSSESDYIL